MPLHAEAPRPVRVLGTARLISRRGASPAIRLGARGQKVQPALLVTEALG
jgi:hypothetical protein